MSSVLIPQSRLSEIAAHANLKNSVVFSDLRGLYQYLKNTYLAGKNINSLYTISSDIENVNVDNIKTFMEKVLRRHLITKVTTRFKLDDQE
jgi:hypothetical protein